MLLDTLDSSDRGPELLNKAPSPDRGSAHKAPIVMLESSQGAQSKVQPRLVAALTYDSV